MNFSSCFVTVNVKIRNVRCSFPWGLCNLKVSLLFFKMKMEKMPSFRGGVEKIEYSAIVENTNFVNIMLLNGLFTHLFLE